MQIIDAHCHIVNFIQETHGINSLIQAMDNRTEQNRTEQNRTEQNRTEQNRTELVSKAVIFGLPIKKKRDCYEPQQPHYYVDDNSRCYYYIRTDEIVAEQITSLPEKDQARFAPLICGFRPDDKLSAQYVEKMLQKYPFWKGIGELLLRHDDLTNLIEGETSRANHPAMDMIYELAVGYDLPVLIHNNISSIGNHQSPLYLHEMTETLERFPHLKIVWAHCGISRRVRVPRHTDILSDLFEKYKNLHCDISWILYEEHILKNKTSLHKRAKLISEYPDRFMIGSDLIGEFSTYQYNIEKYFTLADLLAGNAREMLMYSNADRLYFS